MKAMKLKSCFLLIGLLLVQDLPDLSLLNSQ